MPETARATGVPSMSRMPAAVTRSIDAVALALDGAHLAGLLSRGPEQRVDQVIAGVRQDAASSHLGIESPAAFFAGQGAQPGTGEHGRHHSYRSDFTGGHPAPGFDQAGAEAKLVPDADLEPAAPRQAHDVGRLLRVGRERLFDEHMTTCLEGIHRQAVVRQMGREDRQGVGSLLAQELAMVGIRGSGLAACEDGLRTETRSASASADGRSGSAQPIISTFSSASRRSRWMRAAKPHPAIPIRTTDVLMMPAFASRRLSKRLWNRTQLGVLAFPEDPPETAFIPAA